MVDDSVLLPGPNLEKRIPGSSAQTDAVIADSKAADTVFVATQRADLVTSKNIPDLALEVIIAGEEQSSRDRESNRRDATENLIALIDVQLPIRTDVEETAGGVIRTCSKSVPVGEELNGVDI